MTVMTHEYEAMAVVIRNYTEPGELRRLLMDVLTAARFGVLSQSAMRELADLEVAARHHGKQRLVRLIQVVRGTAFEHFVPPRDAQGCGA